MSAIFGYVDLNNGKIDESIASKMKEPYAKRCRIDRFGEKHGENFYLGCGMQFFSKESVNEELPLEDMASQTYFCADIFLDNREELRISKETPDGRAAFELYLKDGRDFVKKLRGLFSLAIYDAKGDKVILFSDPVDSRCLYYHVEDGVVIFSTLLEPLKNVLREPKTNVLYLKDYLLAPGLMPNIVADETIVEGVKKLLPGERITISKEGVESLRYYSLESNKYKGLCSAKRVGKKFREVYEACVESALRTDGEVSIAMSSGLDSSSVGAIAADKLNEKGKKLYTFTYVPVKEFIEPIKKKKDTVYDETEDVMKIVKMHPNMVPEFTDNGGKSSFDELPETLEMMEIPIKAFVNIPSLCDIISRSVDKGAKIVLTGQTGNASVSRGFIDDILFDLYLHKRYIKMLLWLNSYCKHVKERRRDAVKACFGYFRHSKKVLESIEPLKGYRATNPFLEDLIYDGYPLEDRFAKGKISYLENIPSNREEHRSFLRKDSAMSYLGELDTKFGLKYGILYRDPTKDVRMLEFCYSVPYRFFAYKGTPRWMIRENLKDILPGDILDDWMRYGMQNIDAAHRMMNNIDSIKKEIMKCFEECESEKEKSFISERSFEDFFSKLDYNKAIENDFVLNEAVFTYIGMKY